jgi:hypothetical protein
MRITVMAAGAVGGYFGGRMAAAGHDVTFIARGAHPMAGNPSASIMGHSIFAHRRTHQPTDEPFAAIILCTADPAKVDKRTRSKWSRALRYAAEYKPVAEPLAAFVQRKGGINKCAARFTRVAKARSLVLGVCLREMGLSARLQG